MDKFDEIMGEAKMEYEPTPGFTDKVMSAIEKETLETKHPKHNRGYVMLAFAASVLVITLGVAIFASSGQNENKIPSAGSTSTTVPQQTTPTTPNNYDELDALAEEFDTAIGAMGSDLDKEILVSIETDQLNNDGI